MECQACPRSPGTARKYLSHLNTYWVTSLSKNYATIDKYVDQVRKERAGDSKYAESGASLETFMNGSPFTVNGQADQIQDFVCS
jgi:hypothetical protein